MQVWNSSECTFTGSRGHGSKSSTFYRRMNRATVTVPFPKGQPRLVYRSKMPGEYNSAKELRFIACGPRCFISTLCSTLIDGALDSADLAAAPDRRATRGRGEGGGRGIDPPGLIKTVTFHFSRLNEISGWESILELTSFFSCGWCMVVRSSTR